MGLMGPEAGVRLGLGLVNPIGISDTFPPHRTLQAIRRGCICIKGGSYISK